MTHEELLERIDDLAQEARQNGFQDAANGLRNVAAALRYSAKRDAAEKGAV